MDEAARRQAAVDDFDRKVGLPHGAVDLGSGPDVPTQGIPPEPTEPHPTRIHGSDVVYPEPARPQCGLAVVGDDGIALPCLRQAGHPGDHDADVYGDVMPAVSGGRSRRGDPGVPPMPSTSREPVQYAKVGDPTFDTREPPEGWKPEQPADEQPVDPEGDASYWRAKAEAERIMRQRWQEQAEQATRAALAHLDDEPDREGMHPSVYLADDDAAPIQVDWGTPTDVAYRAACEQLAEAAETFLHDMRAAWARLPARSRPYETHAALLEAIAAYHKAKNRSS